jgi:undecaprenyl-diphosphatase
MPRVSALEALLLGIVQGLTEFLPISSTAHLRIVPAFFGWDDPGAAFTAVIQLGTMAAVLVYFRADLWRITAAWIGSVRARDWHPADQDARLGWYIALGTIPIAILGVAFADTIEDEFRNLELIGSTLIAFSFVMLWAEARSRRRRTMDQLGARDGVLIGCAQALALVPGVSRSGATISAGLLLDFDREVAARYSFLLSVPAVVLAGVFELRHIGEGGAPVLATAIATLFAFVSGYASIAFLLRYVARHSIGVFAAYRIALGAIVIALAASGAIS